MGAQTGEQVDAWVRAGGIVIAASERACRALLSAYHRARRAEGHAAWNTPAIYDWNQFVRQQWTERTTDGRLLLSAMQEQSLWARVIGERGAAAALLRDPLRRMAALAMDAHGLLSAYASRFLEARARGGWRQDAGTFSGWLSAFEEACRGDALLSAARLPLELTSLLEEDAGARPPVFLVGFDRLLPVQRQLLEVWGKWRSSEADRCAERVRSFATADLKSELEACARWCQAQLKRRADARLLVVTQSAGKRRGEIERAFLRRAAEDSAVRFEFSLGVPLASVGIVRAAQLLLGWMKGAITEAEVDWLLSTAYAAGDSLESAELQGAMRELRRRGMQRMRWSLDAFVQLGAGARATFPGAWATRMADAQQSLDELSRVVRRPLEWAAEISRVLELAGWPGPHASSSMEYQALRRFAQVVETCGALGFDGRRMDWKTFSAELNDAVAETLFSPESEEAPILIAGPAESAGLNADAIWFMGAHEDGWPARGSLHPFLPPEIQREYGMPHASGQADFELAQTVTERLIKSADEVCFSYARQEDGIETRASRLVAQMAGIPEALTRELAPQAAEPPPAPVFEDLSRIACAPGAVRGGTAVLTFQSQCPFKAFATARLDARAWDAAEPGLNAAQRGKLLHEVLHAIWRGKPDGLRSLDDLLAVVDRRAFVAERVKRVMAAELDPHLREEIPARYLELETERLTVLVTEWLAYEAARASFSVDQTEFDRGAEIEGLQFKFRLDRVDRLGDGSVLVVDYKTGRVSPKSWDLPRPDDVQLPLYAAFGLPEEWPVGGLAFAEIRAGQACFSGCVKDVEANIGHVQNLRSLKNTALQDGALKAWRENIEQLAGNFLAGRADVNPRDPVKTCERCGLHTLCRVQEQALDFSQDEEDSDGEYEAAGAS